MSNVSNVCNQQDILYFNDVHNICTFFGTDDELENAESVAPCPQCESSTANITKPVGQRAEEMRDESDVEIVSIEGLKTLVYLFLFT